MVEVLNLDVKPFDIESLNVPYCAVLRREVAALKQRKEVLAIGITGSLAYGDIWSGADLDIEVILEGDQPKSIVTTEQEISVDYGYFGERNIGEVPYDTRPIYDPSGILTKELASRNMNEIIEQAIDGSRVRAETHVARAENVIAKDPYSALGWVILSSWPLAEMIILASSLNRTHRRIVTRLEKATRKLGREDIYNDYSKLLGFPETLTKSEELLSELELGYAEIWNHFKGTPSGPVYMVQQPNSLAWFKNRIVPLFNYDRRDLVSLVYVEFLFILSFIFRQDGYERAPDSFLAEATRFEGPPKQWAARYQRILEFFEKQKIQDLMQVAKKLLNESSILAAGNARRRA